MYYYASYISGQASLIKFSLWPTVVAFTYTYSRVVASLVGQLNKFIGQIWYYRVSQKKGYISNFKVAVSGEPFVPGGCPFQKLMYSWVHQSLKRTSFQDKCFLRKSHLEILKCKLFLGHPVRLVTSYQDYRLPLYLLLHKMSHVISDVLQCNAVSQVTLIHMTHVCGHFGVELT